MEDKSISFEVDVQIWASDIVDEFTDEDIIEIAKERGIMVIEENMGGENRTPKPQNTFETLCLQFDLPRATTSKGMLLQHIANLINSEP
jgi:hypothetical protein